MVELLLGTGTKSLEALRKFAEEKGVKGIFGGGLHASGGPEQEKVENVGNAAAQPAAGVQAEVSEDSRFCGREAMIGDDPDWYSRYLVVASLFHGGATQLYGR